MIKQKKELDQILKAYMYAIRFELELKDRIP